jgi:LysM repeat protein
MKSRSLIVTFCLTLALLLAMWPAAVAWADTIYTVQPGDTLWQIAVDHGIGTDTLARANSLPLNDTDTIYAGQKLTIPGSSANSEVNPAPTVSQSSFYIVRPGDTLWQIATRFGFTVLALANANEISDPGLILIGQKLNLIEEPVADDPPSAPTEPEPDPPVPSRPAPQSGPGSLLANQRVVTYYGNPYTGLMGILGRYDPETVVAKLEEQTAEYAALSDKPVQSALHFIATVAQASPGADGMYRNRMPMDLMEEWADLAERHGMLLIIDLQPGRSSVQEEVEAVMPLLERPNVHLALDPEFNMWGSQEPGQQIGHMTADEINWAVQKLSALVASKGLPNKILIVHQFTPNMIENKAGIITDPNVDIVIDMDGFGGQAAKIDRYDYVQSVLVQFAGIKLFYQEDYELLSPSQIMSLDPPPDLIIYQ